MLEKLILKHFQAHGNMVLEFDPLVTVIAGQTDCIAGDAVIPDPVDGSLLSVRDRWMVGKPFHVLSLDSFGRRVVVLAQPPVRFLPKKIYRVITNKSEFRVTEKHRFLTERGDWVSVYCLPRDFSNVQVRLWSSLDNVRQAPLLSELRWKRIVSNWMDHCWHDFCLCGELLPLLLKTSLRFVPSLVCAPERILYYWQRGASGPELEHTHACLLFYHLFSILDSSYLLETCNLYESVPRQFLRRCTHGKRYSQQFLQLLLGYFLVGTVFYKGIFSDHSTEPFSAPPFMVGSKDCTTIIQIRPEGMEEYFDFHVPFFENYYAHESWHHNSGKSSIIRALSWLAFNRPGGDAFISHGSDHCSVSLVVDGRRITRRRGTGENTYRLDNKEFKAFGTEVPEEIQKVLNTFELNVQRQLDPPFLFTLSPGEVSRQLNEVVSLDLIDSVLAKVAAGLRKTKAEQDVVDGRLSAAVARRDGLVWVEEANVKLGNLEKMGKNLEDAASRRASVADLLAKAERCGEAAHDAAQAILDTARAVQAGDRATEAARRADSLRSLLDGIQKCNVQLSMKLPTAALARLEGLAEEAAAASRMAQDLRGMLGRIKGASEDLHTATEALESHEARLKKMGAGRCPTCGQKLQPV